MGCSSSTNSSNNAVENTKVIIEPQQSGAENRSNGESISTVKPLHSNAKTSLFNSIITLSIALESCEAGLDPVKSLHAIVSLQSSAPSDSHGVTVDGNRVPTTAARIPVDMLCILDISSYITPSIDSITESVKFLRNQLTPLDKLAIIVYDTLKVTLVHGFMKMTPNNRQSSETAFEAACAAEEAKISADHRQSASFASTKMINEALDVAIQAFQLRKSENWNTALFLLTDGKDTHQSNSSHQKMQNMCKDLKNMCSQTFVFGAMQSSPLLQKLVGSLEANLSYVDSNNLVETMAGAVGAHLSIIARDVKLQLRFTDAVINKQVSSGFYKVLRSSNVELLEINIGCLYIGEVRDVLIKLSLAESGECPDQEVFAAGASYVNMYDEACCALIVDESIAGSSVNTSLSNGALLEAFYAPKKGDPVLRALVQRVASRRESLCNVEVDAQLIRFAVFAHMERAAAWADARNFGAAQHEIDDLRKLLVTSISCTHRHKVASALLNDLDCISKSLLDEDSYSIGNGSVLVQTFIQAITTQRCVFADGLAITSIFQCLSAAAMQHISSSKPSVTESESRIVSVESIDVADGDS